MNVGRVMPVLAFALIVGGGFLSSGAVPTDPPVATPEALVPGQASPVPNLTWKACGDGKECATASVPLDHRQPQGTKITLALIRLPATDPANRIGSLFVNPGGPGTSGVEMVREFGTQIYSPQVRARFDIVGFDPRFVGGSRPLATCVSDDEFADIFRNALPVPVTRAQEQATVMANAKYTQQCAKRAPFLRHASTANVARDLDLLRQAVGDERLTFVGYSYGSVLGQTYAALFPERIRALVLDGALDAQAWSTGTATQRTLPFTARVDSALGSSDTFGAFLRLCRAAGPGRCAFAAGGDPRVKFDWLALRLLGEPVGVGDDVVGYSQLVTATGAAMYQPLSWSQFARELQTVFELAFTKGRAPAARPGDVRDLLDRARSPRWDGPADLAAVTPGRAAKTADEATPRDARIAASTAVACNDTANPQSPRAWATAAGDQDRRTPHFGRLWTWSGEKCASWPLADSGTFRGTYSAWTSARLLVVGTWYDPATPYSGATAVARNFPNAVLLTVDGYGHPSLAVPSACLTSAFDTYVLTGRTPPTGTVCTQDTEPFAPAG